MTPTSWPRRLWLVGLALILTVVLFAAYGHRLPAHPEATESEEADPGGGAHHRTRLATPLTEDPGLTAVLARASSEPVTWAGSPAPREFSREAFPFTAIGALLTCDFDVGLVGVECDEAPCIIALNGARGMGVSSCRGWTDSFGSQYVDSLTFDVTCDDGSTRSVTVLTPSGATNYTVSPQRQEDVTGRMAVRAKQWSAEWCL